MLTIRNEQIFVFKKNSVGRFRDRMVNILVKHWPQADEKLGRSNFRNLITEAIDQARQFDLHTKYSIAQYLNAMLLVNKGESFNPMRYPWINDLLSRHGISEEEKIKRLNDQIKNTFKLAEIKLEVGPQQLINP